jgi:DNA-binding NarL/FixJ family response regulator
VELTKDGWTVKDIAFDVEVSIPTVAKYQKEVMDVEE